MKEIKDMNLGEHAAFVCDYLNKNGIGCILSGGECVTIYSVNQYQSGDLDFIEQKSYPRKKITGLLKVKYL